MKATGYRTFVPHAHCTESGRFALLSDLMAVGLLSNNADPD